jgi:hypothetical protein
MFGILKNHHQITGSSHKRRAVCFLPGAIPAPVFPAPLGRWWLGMGPKTWVPQNPPGLHVQGHIQSMQGDLDLEGPGLSRSPHVPPARWISSEPPCKPWLPQLTAAVTCLDILCPHCVLSHPGDPVTACLCQEDLFWLIWAKKASCHLLARKTTSVSCGQSLGLVISPGHQPCLLSASGAENCTCPS